VPIDVSLILIVCHTWGSKVARGALLEGAGAWTSGVADLFLR